MNRSAFEKLEAGLRCLLPLVVTVMLVVLAVVPVGIPSLINVKPMVALAAIYYWAIYRPDLLPITATFAIGLLHDVLSGMPLGLTPLVLVPVHAFAVWQRRFFVKRSFLVGWWGFAMLAPVAAALGWITASIYFGSFTTARPLVTQTVLTVAIYPGLAWLFGQVERQLPRQA